MQWDERVGRRLRLKDLHTLQVAAEAGSMAKASQRLALSQPAISNAIASMEHLLGTSLLERSPRGVELTECGRLLVARGRVIFDEVRQGVKEIEHVADPTLGEIRIGATEPLATLLAEITNKLSLQHPRMTFRIEISDTTSLIRALRERALDVVVTRWAAGNAADDVSALSLFRTDLTVLADRRHQLIGAKKLQLKDLMNERWTLSPPESFLGRVVGDAFRRSGLALPKATVTSISVYMRLTLVASGRYLTVLPSSILRHPTDGNWLRAVPVKLKDSPANISVITIRRRTLSGATKLFLKSAREVVLK